jgi:23S rRNA (uracil1939-C5)-methyltransferase
MSTVVTAGPLVTGGAALVRREGEKVMLVAGAIPGEQVEIAVDKDGAQLVKAHVTDVIEPSKYRVKPQCALFDSGCGGCQWHFIDPVAQQTFKVDMVRDSMLHIAKREDAAITFHAAVSPVGYRTTMRMGLRDGRPGMRQLHTNNVLPPIPCTIVHPLLHDLISSGHFNTDANEITLRASVATGDTITFDTLSLNNSDETKWLTEAVCGQEFRISAGAFFQSGPEAAELLTSLVDSLVPDGTESIVDAYAGVGILGAIAAQRTGARLIAVEQNRAAVKDAKHNLAHLDAQVIESEVAEIELGGALQPDVVIADPSRTGLARSASAALARLGASTLILASCDPSSLARDVNLLDGHGYDLKQTHVLELFPQTPHVETVSVFSIR